MKIKTILNNMIGILSLFLCAIFFQILALTDAVTNNGAHNTDLIMAFTLLGAGILAVGLNSWLSKN